ncbi:MAG TPA: cytochrome P450 [Gemmatimonadales bacterium]
MTDRQPSVQVPVAELEANPYPVFHRLRREQPVVWVEPVGMWFVTRYDDVVQVLRDSVRFTTDAPGSTIRDTFGAQMLSADGDDQRRFKSACAAPFNTRAVREGAAALVEAKVTSLLASAAGAARAELRTGLAGPLALYTIATVLGIPERHHGAIRGWYDAFAESLANFGWDPVVRQRGHQAAKEFKALVRPLLAELATEAPHSLLGARAAMAPPPLSEEEIMGNALIILFGGIETTEAMILNALWAILTQPGILALVRERPDRLGDVIEEATRWESAVQSCTRHATEAVVLRGVAIPAGDTVQCLLGAANRDPSVFPEPDRFDPDRPNLAAHLAFGSGRHFCLGAALARLEAQTAISAMLARWPVLRLENPLRDAPRGMEFRKPAELHIVLDDRG